jgi:integrase
MKAVVSIYQDQRHEKKDGTYPVKIRVYDGRSTKWFSIGVSLTEKDFKKVLSGKGLTGDLLKHKNTIEEKRLKASQIIDTLRLFSFKEFERKFEMDSNVTVDVFSYFNDKIKELQEQEQIKTSIVYLHASDSFRRFLQPKPTKTNPERTTEELRADKSIILPFADVDDRWLNRYQKWMIDNGNTLTTVSMYLRALRHIFNNAINKEIGLELYPFGKDGYVIPKGNKRKQIFEKQDLQNILRTLWKYKTNDELITKARDFWFFIYNAYGMNVADIVRLKDTNIIGNQLHFTRKKTERTNKNKDKEIQVPITAHMQHVFDKYGQDGEGYIFDVLNHCKDEAERVAATDSFTTFINDHMERLCKLTGVPVDCTTYTARHLFGTMAIRNGAPTALVQKAFGHQSILTTENYIGDFDEEAKRKVSDQLMKF